MQIDQDDEHQDNGAYREKSIRQGSLGTAPHQECITSIYRDNAESVMDELRWIRALLMWIAVMIFIANFGDDLAEIVRKLTG